MTRPGSKTSWENIPRPVRSFLLKSVILFAVWKILYLSLLLPYRILDRPLTRFVGTGASRTLNLISWSKDFSAADAVNNSPPQPGEPATPEKVMAVRFHDERVLSVADVCNGLELMVLYAGFIICLPAGISRKAAFITGGILLIFLVNVLRCAALVLVYLHYPKYVEFFHHYVFTFLVYGFIFWLWFLFSSSPGSAKSLRSSKSPGPGSSAAPNPGPDDPSGSAKRPVSAKKINLDVLPR